MAKSNLPAQVDQLVRTIPRGMCSTYGRIGAALNPKVSGLIVGRLMASVSTDAPWWRVVAASGELPVYKRAESLFREQRNLLEDEKVPFLGEKVDLSKCLFDF